jgi:hypothetical protein
LVWPLQTQWKPPNQYVEMGYVALERTQISAPKIARHHHSAVTAIVIWTKISALVRQIVALLRNLKIFAVMELITIVTS